MRTSNAVLNEKVEPRTAVYVGRRQLRHGDEPNEKQEYMLENNPAAVPHTFVDFTGATLGEIMEHAGGKQGCVVDAQKVIRDRSTLNEVKAWRDQFDAERFGDILTDAHGVSEKVLDEIAAGEPFVIIRFTTAGHALNVPRQPADMLDDIQEHAPEIYQALFADLSGTERLEKVVTVYDQLQSMIG